MPEQLPTIVAQGRETSKPSCRGVTTPEKRVPLPGAGPGGTTAPEAMAPERDGGCRATPFRLAMCFVPSEATGSRERQALREPTTWSSGTTTDRTSTQPAVGRTAQEG